MGSQSGRAMDPPKAKLAARVAIVSLSALAGYSLLGTMQHLDLVSVLDEWPSWVGSFVFLSAVAGYLFWLFRRHHSLPWIDVLPDEGAGRAVLWHFVPVANIVKPYETLCEIWDATAAEDEPQVRFRAPVSIFWAAVLGEGALITLQVFKGRSMSDAAFRTLDAFAGLLFLCLGVAGVVMILQIERRWSRRYALLTARYDAPPEHASPDFLEQPSIAEPSESWMTARAAVAEPGAAAAGATAVAAYRPAAAVAVPGVPAAAERPRPSTSHRPAPPGPAAMTALANLRSAGTTASILALLMGAQILLLLASGMSQGAVVLLYAAVALFSAIPAIHLWGFSRAAEQCAGSPTEINLRNVLRSLGRFWAFIGGFVVLVLILQVVLIGLGIFIALFATAVRS